MNQTVSKQQWLEWINEQEQSGLSVAAFCRSRTINLDNFYYHRSQQRKKSQANSTPFIRAQRMTESAEATTPHNIVKIALGNMIIYLPLDNPLHTARLIKALQ